MNPDLVVRDADGNVSTVHYEAMNAMLFNEFLKEHRKVEEQGAIIAKQQKQIDALTAGLQKVTARVETANSVSRIVSDSKKSEAAHLLSSLSKSVSVQQLLISR